MKQNIKATPQEKQPRAMNDGSIAKFSELELLSSPEDVILGPTEGFGGSLNTS